MTYDFRKAADLEAMVAYNLQLAKLLQRLKKDAGATTVTANYKGTGSKRHRRQLFVRFKSGAVLDLWLEGDSLEFGGVMRPKDYQVGGADLPRSLPYAGKTPEEVYKAAAELLNAWANPPANPT